MAACLSHAVSSVLPEPHFEGSEKRVEVDFLVPEGSDGLRALSRQQLDELMSLAHCCIVSSRSNACFDAYVLSESSLFVYPRKWVLKTCGTTRLLDSLPRLLELTGEMGLVATRCKYTRASFLFPENQVRAACSGRPRQYRRRRTRRLRMSRRALRGPTQDAVCLAAHARAALALQGRL